jgi:CRP-like cAMP-binding protein
MSENNGKFDDLIRQLVPISELSTTSQNKIIEQSQVQSFAEESYIFKQGDDDDYTFYLLDGQLEMQAMDEASFNVTTKEDRAKYPLAQVQPRKYSAKAISSIKVLQINRNMLEAIVAQEKSADASSGLEADEVESEESMDWMSLILQSSFFSKIPAANIQQLFVMLQPVNKRAGDVVIKQGDAGDYYYIIQDGRCEVTRESTTGDKPDKLAELSPGASFGEESLLSDKPRNATVTMLTNGILMQLSKENFIELIKKPTLDSISFNEAQKIIEEGGNWLDVRTQKEYNESNIINSIHIPIFDIRRESDKLQINKQFIIYSNSKRRGAAAAFLLTELGFNVRYLENGLASIPENFKEKILQKNELIEADEGKGIEKAKTGTDNDAKNKDEDLKKLDNFDDTVEQEAIITHRDQRKQLQDRIKNIITSEQEKSEQKVEVEELVEEKIEKQEANNQEIITADEAHKIEDHIKEEKKELEELHARNLKEKEELYNLRKEAEELIKKERKSLDLIHTQQQERLTNERKNVEEESRKIQATLKEIQAARVEAEATRINAEKNAKQLKEKQTLTEEDMTKTSLNILNEDIKSAENKLNQAQKKLIYADQAEETIKTAKEMNEQDMLRHSEEEERIQKQLEEEMAAWSKEQEEHKDILKQASSHEESINNMKAKIENEKKESEKATQALFSDIESELHKE